MWKCRFCSFETDNYEELIDHEKECYKKFVEVNNKKRNEELVADMNKLNTYKLEYERYADKMKKTYTKDELVKFNELFPIDKIDNDEDKIKHNENSKYVCDEINEDDIYKMLLHAAYGR
jgi:hypothetical protein